MTSDPSAKVSTVSLENCSTLDPPKPSKHLSSCMRSAVSHCVEAKYPAITEEEEAGMRTPSGLSGSQALPGGWF